MDAETVDSLFQTMYGNATEQFDQAKHDRREYVAGDYAIGEGTPQHKGLWRFNGDYSSGRTGWKFIRLIR